MPVFLFLAAGAAVAGHPLDAFLAQAEHDPAGAVAALRAEGSPGAQAWADWLAATGPPDGPDAARRLRAVGDAAPGITVPCWLLRDRADAEAAFGGWTGSSRDAFPPVCRPAVLHAPTWQAFHSAVSEVASTIEEGAWCGTMATATARDRHVSHLTRFLRDAPRDVATEQARADAAVLWAAGLRLDELQGPLDRLGPLRDAARTAGPAWWVDAAAADRLEATRTCVGDHAEHRPRR